MSAQTQNQTPSTPAIAIDSLATVTIDGVAFIGIVIDYDPVNGNLQVAIQDLPLPIWATPAK